MRDALQIRYETGHPLIVRDEAGIVLGILGDGELYGHRWDTTCRTLCLLSPQKNLRWRESPGTALEHTYATRRYR